MAGSGPDERTPRWFKFYPERWSGEIPKTNYRVGERFKQMLSRLTSGDAPEGTEERRMLDEAREFSARQRSRISGYWKSRRDDPAPAENESPPSLEEVYDLCAVAGIDPDTGREFHEWLTRRNLWKDLRTPWNVALRGFDRRRKAASRNQNQNRNQNPEKGEDEDA